MGNRHTAKKLYLFLLITIGTFIVGSCMSTRIDEIVDEEFFVQINANDNFFIDGETYIFLRLYNPKYKNALSPGNILRAGIKLTEVNSFTASHLAIGFDLNDNFYGVTAMGRPQLKVEHLSNRKGNEFLEACNPKKSQQITCAIKVTAEEYEKAKRFLIKNRYVQYDVNNNFKIARYAIKRSFFTKKEKQDFINFYRSDKDIEAINAMENQRAQKKFICSGFIAYILYNSIQSVHDFFTDNRIDYRYITVTDILSIPGVELLFSSYWDDYMQAAGKFVMQHEKFAMYFTDEIYYPFIGHAVGTVGIEGNMP
ncbi:MAG: hypothetical protein J6I73_00385 [Treponema sp.]|nr:hypothetical protein [Treponema sp.]